MAIAVVGIAGIGPLAGGQQEGIRRSVLALVESVLIAVPCLDPCDSPQDDVKLSEGILTGGRWARRCASAGVGMIARVSSWSLGGGLYPVQT